MDVTAVSKTNYDVKISMSEEELDELLTEMELIFIRSIAEGVNKVPRLTELKNLITLSVNNS